jgi:hypothetical protein
MANEQAINPQRQAEVIQFPRNDAYLKDRQVEAGPSHGGGGGPIAPPPSGGGSSPHSGGQEVTVAKLQEHIRGAFVWLGMLTVAFGIAFLYTIGKVDDRFDKLDQPVREIQSVLAGQTATLKAIDDRLLRTESKMDSHGSDLPKNISRTR